MAAWYYSDQGSKRGPVSEQEFGHLVRQGSITNATLVWRSGMGDWMPLSDALLEPEEAASALPLYEPSTRPQDGFPPAGVGIRFLAKLIDSMVLSIPTGLMVFTVFTVAANAARNPDAAAGPRSAITVLIVTALVIAAIYWYEVILVATSGGTPGKRLFNLRIIKEDGRPLTHGAALGRFLAQGASSMFFGFGYWMAIFDRQKRAMHDHMCRTRVVRVPAAD